MEESGGVATANTSTRKHPHVLLLTLEDEGHFTLFLQLLYYLSTLDAIAVTICTSKWRVNQLQALQSKGDFDGFTRLRLVQLSEDDASKPEPPIFQVSRIMKMQFQSFRQTLIEDSDPSNKLTCVIADALLDWAAELADELRIARYIVVTAGSWLPYTYLRTRSDSWKKSESDTLDVPGYSTFLVKDLPFRIYDTLRLENLAGVLANSFEELEGTAIFDAMRDSLRHRNTKAGESKIARVLPIGPMLLLPGYPKPYPNTKRGNGSQSSKALEWLDHQATASVVYVAFGTKADISTELIFEVARGLELSNVPFLWVLRGPSSITDLTSIIPPGFLERVEKRGFVETEWAPQSQILHHGSIGAFMSHCGWNSMMESIVAGVPILTWPLAADQPRNAKFIVESLKVGVPVWKAMSQRDPGFIIQGEDVAAAVRLLMVDEKAQEIRKNSFG